jgi:hypothetical protein
MRTIIRIEPKTSVKVVKVNELARLFLGFRFLLLCFASFLEVDSNHRSPDRELTERS